DGDIPNAVLLFRHRAPATQDSALQRYATSYCGMDHAAAAGGIPRTLPLSLRHLRSGPKVQCGGAKLPRSSRSGAETHQRACTLAEWPCGAMDRKLPAGDSSVPIVNSKLDENMEFAHSPSNLPSGAKPASSLGRRRSGELQISNRPAAGKPCAPA